MTDSTSPGPPTPLGQVIGQASVASQAIFAPLLDQHHLAFGEWVVLNSIAVAQEPLATGVLVARVADLRNTDTSETEASLDAVVAAGLVSTDAGFAQLTDRGRSRHRSMTDGIAVVGNRLTGDLPAEDLAATRRILAIYTERARAEAAAAR